VLIRQSITSSRPVTPEEVGHILVHIATAPFARETIGVPARYRHLTHQRRTLAARESSLIVHLIRRVHVDEQWAAHTTPERYIADLHDAARHPAARLAVYYRTGQHSAAVLTPNALPESRCGAKPEAFIFVVYSADRGTITTGYQVSGIETINLPDRVRWLR
jgi:hypothetical protein